MRDAPRFIKTGRALSREDLAGAHWPLARSPYLLEASLPGVFAVGDVRGGNTKAVVNVISPGPTNTELSTERKSDADIQRLADMSALGGIGEP